MKHEQKQLEEQNIVRQMISIYCKKKHGTKEELCSECQELFYYAKQRIEQCPFMETKTFCSACKVHCYRNDMREKIRQVMKFSGPRMLFRHPKMTMYHMFVTIRSKWKS